MIGTDCTGSCKSNYHTIATTTTPIVLVLYYFCLSLFCGLCPMLPVSLDFPFLIAFSVFSNLYLHILCFSLLFLYYTMICMQNDVGVGIIHHGLRLPASLPFIVDVMWVGGDRVIRCLLLFYFCFYFTFYGVY